MPLGGGSIIVATMWNVWLEKNNHIFNNKLLSVLSIFHHINHIVLMWAGNNQQQQDLPSASGQPCHEPRRQLDLQHIIGEEREGSRGSWQGGRKRHGKESRSGVCCILGCVVCFSPVLV